MRFQKLDLNLKGKIRKRVEWIKLSSSFELGLKREADDDNGSGRKKSGSAIKSGSQILFAAL